MSKFLNIDLFKMPKKRNEKMIFSVWVDFFT